MSSRLPASAFSPGARLEYAPNVSQLRELYQNRVGSYPRTVPTRPYIFGEDHPYVSRTQAHGSRTAQYDYSVPSAPYRGNSDGDYYSSSGR